MGSDLIWFVIATAVALAAGAGWCWGTRYRPSHKRVFTGPQHAAVSVPVPRAGSMCLDAELLVRGSDDPAAHPSSPLPWLASPPAAQAITAAALADPEQDWADPLLSRLLRTTGEIMSGRLLAEVTSELDRQDRDAAEFLSRLAAQTALARLHIMEGWS